MNVTYNIPKTAVSITGDYSHQPIHITTEAAQQLGGFELAYHEIKRLQHENLLPRMGSQARPLTLRDLELAQDNERRGFRYWQWRQFDRGRTYFYGYGYQDGDEFVIVNRDGSVFERIAL